MRKAFLLLLIVAVSPSFALAETGFELTPFFGYRWGGEIRAENNDLFDVDLDIDSGESYGILADFPITRNLMFEVLASRQSTELVDEGGLFGNDRALLGLDVTYYHIGVLYQWPNKDFTGFIVGTAGVGELDVDLPGISDEEEFSMSAGGGFKLYFSPRLALRVDGRFYWTDTNQNDWDWDDCEDDECWHGNYGNDLTQTEIKIGLAIGF